MSTQTLTTIPASGKKPRVRMERVNWSGTIIPVSYTHLTLPTTPYV